MSKCKDCGVEREFFSHAKDQCIDCYYKEKHKEGEKVKS
jgi:ribosomal protein S27E